MNAPAHITARWTGVFGGGLTASDIWSMGLNFALEQAPLFAADLAPFTQVMLDAWIAHCRPHIATFARLTACKASFTGPDGLVLREGSGAYIQHLRNASSQGGNASTAASGINQVSLAVSTQSQSPGATGRGRFFLPAPGIGPDAATGLLPEANAQAIATDMASFVNQLNTGPPGGPVGDAAIASGGSVKKGLQPAMRRIVQVRVGRRLDVIRSRANAIPEGYKVAPVAA